MIHIYRTRRVVCVLHTQRFLLLRYCYFLMCRFFLEAWFLREHSQFVSLRVLHAVGDILPAAHNYCIHFTTVDNRNVFFGDGSGVPGVLCSSVSLCVFYTVYKEPLLACFHCSRKIAHLICIWLKRVYALSLSLSREELGTRCVATLFYNVVDRKRELCPGRNFGAHLKSFFVSFFFLAYCPIPFFPSHSLWFSSCP